MSARDLATCAVSILMMQHQEKFLVTNVVGWVIQVWYVLLNGFLVLLYALMHNLGYSSCVTLLMGGICLFFFLIVIFLILDPPGCLQDYFFNGNKCAKNLSMKVKIA